MMPGFVRQSTWALSALAAVSASVAQASDLRNFVACPIFQDTKTVPCWLAEFEGKTYFLGIQTDQAGWAPPFLGHKILVEGKLAGGPAICGGIPLTRAVDVPQESNVPGGYANGRPMPLSPMVSSLRELDPTCRTALPANPDYVVEGRRGPGPSTPRFDARPPVHHEYPTPYQTQKYAMYYDFDLELSATSTYQAVEAVHYAQMVKAKRVEIVGYRMSAKLSDGTTISELPDMDRFRAEEVENVIQRLGLPAETELKTSWKTADAPGNEAEYPLLRRTEITVIP